jgi:AcrR family transcriptional regulator
MLPVVSLSKTDGRLGRSLRSRAAVAEALLALIEEGDLRPTAPRIAARAGVSLRLVFHHFKDLEAVFADASKREIERVVPSLKQVPASGALEPRIEAYIGERSRLLERVFTMWRAAALQEPFSPEISKHMKMIRAWLRADTERVFAKELEKLRGPDKSEMLTTLHAVTSMGAWKDLRLHQDLSLDKARRATVRAVSSVLKKR